MHTCVGVCTALGNVIFREVEQPSPLLTYPPPPWHQATWLSYYWPVIVHKYNIFYMKVAFLHRWLIFQVCNARRSKVWQMILHCDFYIFAIMCTYILKQISVLFCFKQITNKNEKIKKIWNINLFDTFEYTFCCQW